MNEDLYNAVDDCIKAASFLREKCSLEFIQAASEKIVSCYQEGGKILIAGNGGSLCDAMHFAEELTGYYRSKRKALAAIALADPGHLTCVGNDVGFDQVFARSIEALGKEGDIFIALSTSGNSINLVHAVDLAKAKGLTTIGFLGRGGGVLKDRVDLAWVVEGFSFADRVQEVHMAAMHVIIELVEKELFSCVVT
ncbi:MAG: SIS domain-containing protein [Chlamydiae bacterium]|nr:SIS domain-containing protein [Chlamydiota bacterium]